MMAETEGINIDDFIDVVYRCKFCQFSCTHSPDMGIHVRQKHLSSSQKGSPAFNCSPLGKSDVGPIKVCSASSAVLTSPALTSPAVLTSPVVLTSPAMLTSSSCLTSHPSAGTDTNIEDSEEVLGFTSPDTPTFLDKVTFNPVNLAMNQSQSLGLDHASTPDLTDLIGLDKPTARSQDNAGLFPVNSPGRALMAGTSTCHYLASSGHLTDTLSQLTAADDQLTMTSVVQLQGGSTSLSSLSQSFPGATLVSGDMDVIGASSPYTVMAIHLSSLGGNGSSSLPQYVVSAPVSEPLPLPEHTETKEFLLCGLCKLAFTTMDQCQNHMQSEHQELMQSSGIGIGVQAGGARRGRKRKTDQIKAKEVIYEADDIEWLPSVTDSGRSHHADGGIRRKIRPPRALKEDFVLGRSLKKRMRETSMNLGYKLGCPMMSCKARFKTETGLHIHMSCHNLEDTAFTCKECQAPHEFWKQLRMHLWKEHRVDSDLFSCDRCDYKTDTHHKMNIHKEIHTDAKPYSCHVCGKGFRQASQMKNHQVTHLIYGKERNPGWFTSKICDICDRTFANSKCLKNHKAAVHTNHKPFQCIYCSHTTARKAMMELHIRTHTGEKPFKCDLCNYSTGDHNSLRRHKMRHTGQKQYKCTQCHYTCIQSISLKQHMRHKHPGTSAGIFQCSRCPFRSINQEIYSNHMQDHRKGLIPDKIIPPRLELAKVKKTSRRQASSSRQPAASQAVIEALLMKHPQFHAVLPGQEPAILSGADSGSNANSAEAFNMQVTVLPDGDTQISSEDMSRLSESNSLHATGVSPLQLIYSTLSTISDQGHICRVQEGKSTLLTAELIGGIHAAVLSSVQEGVVVHSVTYHIPKMASDLENEKKFKLTIEKSDDKNFIKSDIDQMGDRILNENNVTSIEYIDVKETEISASQNVEPVSLFNLSSSEMSHVPTGDLPKATSPRTDSLSILTSDEKVTESRSLRDLLMSGPRLTDLNSQNQPGVSFLGVDFLDRHQVSSPLAQESVTTAVHASETKSEMIFHASETDMV